MTSAIASPRNPSNSGTRPSDRSLTLPPDNPFDILCSVVTLGRLPCLLLAGKTAAPRPAAATLRPPTPGSVAPAAGPYPSAPSEIHRSRLPSDLTRTASASAPAPANWGTPPATPASRIGQ